MKQTTQSLKESLYEVFDPQDINCVHEELWRWVKAASNNELYLHMGDPSFILFMERKFKRMIRYAWHLHQKHKDEFIAEPQMLSPLSDECIEQQRQHMLQLDDLITRYKGTIRRLSKAETENPLLFLHRFFQYINSKKEWYQILHSWAEYSLSRSSMLDFSNDVDLEAYELIEGLLESMYLMHLQDNPNPEYLDPMVKLLIEAIAPQMVFEIRHLDKSKQSESGTELLIILPDSCQKRLSELEPILEIITVSNRQLSCALYTSSFILDKLKSGHIYFSFACTSSNLIYGSAQSLFDKSAQESMASAGEKLHQAIHKAQKIFDTGLQKAQAFHVSAIAQSQRSLGLFMLHQAAELTLRSITLALYGYEKKTHSFKALMQISKRVAPALSEVFRTDNAEEQRHLQLLEAAYIHGRYTHDFEVSEEDFQAIYDRVKKLITHSISIFNDRLNLFVDNETSSE